MSYPKHQDHTKMLVDCENTPFNTPFKSHKIPLESCHFLNIYSLTPLRSYGRTDGRTVGRYFQKKCDKWEFLRENITRIQFSNGRIGLSKAKLFSI